MQTLRYNVLLVPCLDNMAMIRMMMKSCKVRTITYIAVEMT